MPVISPSTKSDNYKIAFGSHTTAAAVDTIDTGLSTVIAVVAQLGSDLVDDPTAVSAAPAAAAGRITVKTWKNTAGTDPTPAAATTFGKNVQWIAIGY